MITNGYLLTAERIQRLNRAGLEHLQISIDNVMPDEVSKKSLKVLDRKLQLLAATRRVSRQYQLGGGRRHPHIRTTRWWSANARWNWDSLPRSASFTTAAANCSRWATQEREVYTAMRSMEKSSYAQINYFQDNIAHGKENDWRCRSGARYLYICEDGLVHYCSQQRGYPAKPLGGIYRRGYSPRVPHRQKLRPALHRGLRAPDFLYRFLARQAGPYTLSGQRTNRSGAGATAIKAGKSSAQSPGWYARSVCP